MNRMWNVEGRNKVRDNAKICGLCNWKDGMRNLGKGRRDITSSILDKLILS